MSLTNGAQSDATGARAQALGDRRLASRPGLEAQDHDRGGTLRSPDSGMRTSSRRGPHPRSVQTLAGSTGLWWARGRAHRRRATRPRWPRRGSSSHSRSCWAAAAAPGFNRGRARG